jgi:hypothetical protein
VDAISKSPNPQPTPQLLQHSRIHKSLARALKKIPCPQSPVNGWAGAVMSPEMYVLIDPNLFHLNNVPITTATPAYPIKYNPEGAIVPDSCKEKSTIDAKFSMVKNYFKSRKNIYPACYDTLKVHVNDAFNVAPPTTLPTAGWNTMMSLCDIFDQLATTYGKPNPDSMHQNNLTFLAV